MACTDKPFSPTVTVITAILLLLFFLIPVTACDSGDGSADVDKSEDRPGSEVTSQADVKLQKTAIPDNVTKNTVGSTKNPVVKMETNKGIVFIELFADKAPQTVKNFLHYVDEGVYDSTIFHRVVRDQQIQAGAYDFDQKPIKTTFPAIRNEADNGLKNKRGTIAMIRNYDPHSATRQFFINMSDNTKFDFKDKTPVGWGFCVFGKVIEGMEVMDNIGLVKTTAYGPFDRYAPKLPVIIRRISVVED